MRTEEIICGDSPSCQIPGGWGAAGGPNDGSHQYLHQLTKAYHCAAINWGSTLELRSCLDEMNVSIQGHISTKYLGCIVSRFMYIYIYTTTYISIERDIRRCLYIHTQSVVAVAETFRRQG